MTQTTWEPLWIQDYISYNKINITKTIVDVGAGDGEHSSNSEYFIVQGWNALLIDALPSNINKCRQLHLGRPFVKYLTAVLSDKEEDVYFEQDTRHWALSSIKEGEPNRRTSKLSNILAAMGFTEIGILSLDIEGYESKVLNDLMDNRIYPQIIIVEGNTFEAMQEHRDILELKYKFIGMISPNQVFLRL